MLCCLCSSPKCNDAVLHLTICQMRQEDQFQISCLLGLVLAGLVQAHAQQLQATVEPSTPLGLPPNLSGTCPHAYSLLCPRTDC